MAGSRYRLFLSGPYRIRTGHLVRDRHAASPSILMAQFENSPVLFLTYVIYFGISLADSTKVAWTVVQDGYSSTVMRLVPRVPMLPHFVHLFNYTVQ